MVLFKFSFLLWQLTQLNLNKKNLLLIKRFVKQKDLFFIKYTVTKKGYWLSNYSLFLILFFYFFSIDYISSILSFWITFQVFRTISQILSLLESLFGSLRPLLEFFLFWITSWIFQTTIWIHFYYNAKSNKF